ncbi:diaminopimelate epimerase [Campylobacter pinnipediorum]|uniref:diaminopimelate epimerase n=1 Tax=Campylobacter pinnipediorum TaxID=1965231 RepID=UPI00084D7362|nr:diaminopimelate epimerase [Campylobacter pinnipediorum]
MIVSKYNASGNDFVVFHTFLTKDRSELAKKICDRQNGVGADGLIVLKPGIDKDHIEWEFYNSDGSIANMCGNGSRAAARYAFDNGLAYRSFFIKTGSGDVGANVSFDVEVELTSPKILSDDVIDEFGFKWYFYDTGVPHLVCYVDDLDKFDIEICKQLRHKYNANVNYAKFFNDELFVRTYERGVEGETLACGTGMAACFYGGILNFNLSKKINVYPKSGEKLGLELKNNKIFFKGFVKHCFDVNFDI